jgi:hypothetical protein
VSLLEVKALTLGLAALIALDVFRRAEGVATTAEPHFDWLLGLAEGEVDGVDSRDETGEDAFRNLIRKAAKGSDKA